MTSLIFVFIFGAALMFHSDIRPWLKLIENIRENIRKLLIYLFMYSFIYVFICAFIDSFPYMYFRIYPL